MAPQITSNLYPSDILAATTPFGTLARVAAYGRSEWWVEHSLKNPIPRIAHYVCIDCEVRFITFLSMRSSVNVAGLSKVCTSPRGTDGGMRDKLQALVYDIHPPASAIWLRHRSRKTVS